jgi:hypothetical protein
MNEDPTPMTAESADLAYGGLVKPPFVNVEKLGEAIGLRANARSVFGDPIERDGLTVVPVARVRWGFGGGGGNGKEGDGGGGGGGANAAPAGYIEISSGQARFRPIVDPAGFAVPVMLLAGLALLVLGPAIRYRIRGRGLSQPAR